MNIKHLKHVLILMLGQSLGLSNKTNIIFLKRKTSFAILRNCVSSSCDGIICKIRNKNMQCINLEVK